MGVVHQDFVVNTKSGSFDRLIESMERGVRMADAQAAALNRIEGAAATISAPGDAAADSMVRVSDATQDLVERLGVYQEAFSAAFTESQADKAMDTLISKMENMGLVFTTKAGEMAASDALANQSLQELANSGEIAANSLAQVKFEERVAAEAEKVEKNADKLSKSSDRAAKSGKSAVSAFMGFGKASNPVQGLANRIGSTMVMLFSVRRVLGYITDAMDRAPAGISNSFKAMGTNIKDSFTRVVVSAMGGMRSGLDRLNKAMNSNAGQRLFRGLERAAELAGKAVGYLMEVAGSVIEFLGNHATEVFTVLAIAVGFFAAQMLISASASLLAAWPILLIVGLAAALVTGLMAAGVTSEEIFGKIGQGAGWLYAFGYNLVADAYNLFATFAEFFANVFHDPVGATVHLFVDAFDVILSMVETVAKAIDKLTGSSLSSGVSVFRSNLQQWANNEFGENKIKIARMEKIGYMDTAASWGDKARSIGASFSLGTLDTRQATELKAIKSDTGAIKKAVAMSEEDIKSLVDIAERRYVNQVNLSTLQPIINVNGANTGRTTEDRQALADAIKEVLIEQTSSGAAVATIWV